MKTNFTYLVKTFYSETNILDYYCKQFNASFSDLGLLINRFSNYLVSLKSNYNYNLNVADMLEKHDFTEFLRLIIENEIIDLLVIPKDYYSLTEMLSEMQDFFPLVNSYYTIDLDENYQSKYDKMQVIKIIYSEILIYAISDISYSLEDIINILAKGYQIESISIKTEKEFVDYENNYPYLMVYFEFKGC